MSSYPLPGVGPVPVRKVALVLALAMSMALVGAGLAAASPIDACTLLPRAAIAQIIGNDAPIVRHVAPLERDGVIGSSCVFQQTGGAGKTGFITVSTFESEAAAQAHLTSYADKIAAAGGDVAVDTVGGRPASFITSEGGNGQMFVIQGKVLVGAGVVTRRKGMTTSLPDLSRQLATAALAGL